MNYEELIKKIKQRKHFSFSRWGDGEFLCMQSGFMDIPNKVNTDKHKYYSGLGVNLSLVLEGYDQSKNYIHGLQNMAKNNHSDLVERYFYPF